MRVLVRNDQNTIECFECIDIVVEVLHEDGVGIVFSAKCVDNKFKSEYIELLSEKELENLEVEKVIEYIRNRFVPLILSMEIIDFVSAKELLKEKLESSRFRKIIDRVKYSDAKIIE